MKKLSLLLLLIPRLVLGGTDIWGKGEVPSITDRNDVPRTLNEIWDAYEKDYDKNNPLEAKIHKTWETDDGIVVNWVQVTVGTFRGKKAVICGYFAYPKGAKNLPAILAFTGGAQGAAPGIAENWARLGYVGFHPHNSGGPITKGEAAGLPGTDWGVIQHKGGFGPYGSLTPIINTEINNTIDDVLSPRNSFYFPRQISSRRIISFLSQQPQVNPAAIGVTGHSTGGALATQVSIDPRIAAAVPSMGGAGGLYLPHPHLTGNTRNQGNLKGDDLEVLKGTIDGYAYYRKMHAPVLVLGCSNDFNAPDYNCIESLKLARVDKRFSSAANLSHRTMPEVAMAGYQWFETHLKGAGLQFPETAKAELVLNQKDGVPVLRVKAPRSKRKIKRVEMVFSNDGDVKKRVWTSVTPESNEKGVWSIKTPVSDLDKPLFGFANFIYEVDPVQTSVHPYCGATEMCVTSEYASRWPDELNAACAAETAGELWQASWIGAAEQPQGEVTNQWTCFRKTVHLDKEPRQAVVRIAVDSKYWLWVNGEMVVFEGQLKRGPTPNDTYYDRVDLTNYLQQGDNTIAVLAWYFGKEGFSHKSSGKAGFVFDADVDGKPLLSDQSWKSILHPAFGETDAPHPNFRLSESNIHFDARKDIPGWQNPGFDDSRWPAAVVFGKPPCAPWNRLVERPIPQWKDFGLKEYVNAADLPIVSDGKMFRARLPYNAQVTPYLKIEAPAGKTIGFQTDNYGAGPNIRGEYVTHAGVQEYENLGWISGHEVQYAIPAGIRILGLKYRETGYETEFAGRFECDDDFLNRYRQKALRTLYVNMRDTYMDCPERERAQWWGDVVNLSGQAFYALDSNSTALVKKGILELMNWQRDSGIIGSPVPAGNWDHELPLQMLNSVGTYGFWNYYLYSGDLDTIRAVYPRVKRYLSLWQMGDDGLVVPRGGRRWIDHGEHKDVDILYNGWYYLALKGQLNMAKALGEDADLPDIKARMASIEQNFNKTFWNGSAYRSPGYKGETDDRAQALAVLTGLAGPDKYEAIRKVLNTEYHSSPYMEKYVGEALYKMRFEEDAIARTKKRYQQMVESPLTTLWEIWDRGTRNHAWGGGMLTLLSQYGAGVAPVTPGYTTYQVLPQMGPLKHIQTTVPSVKGDIDVALVNDAGVFTLELTSPDNTTAFVGIPRTGADVSSVEVNGTTVWSNGKAAKILNGLAFLDNTEHYIKFSVVPGKWSFKAD